MHKYMNKLINRWRESIKHKKADAAMGVQYTYSPHVWANNHNAHRNLALRSLAREAVQVGD